MNDFVLDDYGFENILRKTKNFKSSALFSSDFDGTVVKNTEQAYISEILRIKSLEGLSVFSKLFFLHCYKNLES
jgi:hypothetical protein